ncbi:hypothetical protein DdX_11721 [Ditylenchus destructor]|uniref:F-box domain-containing protein n=1 Tax=Ditylenchus destructor TaxID=166010 RepID=A0AAD4MWU6_9BILA|nr:hypothetical protein DdX_11721 [Ditylenchus destructor]
MAEKQALSEDIADEGSPKAKKSRSDDRIPNIIVLDNVTMVEAFKYLKYIPIAKISLVSKRFRDLIQTHRHSLSRHYVVKIRMQSNFNNDPATNKVFNKKLSADSYNDWVTCNQYSKQIPVQSQDGGEQSARDHGDVYQLRADALGWRATFYAKCELNHENWPLFQHFVRLLTAPHIYISYVELTPQPDFLNLLAGAVKPSRLQCKTLYFSLNDNIQKYITWVKGHVSCEEFQISDFNFETGYKFKRELLGEYDEALLDFFVTGTDCTRNVNVIAYDCANAVVDFVQKFMDLKSCDECQMIRSISSDAVHRIAEMMKRHYAKFLVKEEYCKDDCDWDDINAYENLYYYTIIVYEFINNDIGKKLEFTAKIHWRRCNIAFDSSFKLVIKNL